MRLVILGQPVSLKNSRKQIPFYGKKGEPRFNRPRIISLPSDECAAWMKSIRKQVPRRNPLLTGELAVYVMAYYRDERSDLDVEALFDALQGWLYKNDRQLRRKYLDHGIDKHNPRVELRIEPRQAELL